MSRDSISLIGLTTKLLKCHNIALPYYRDKSIEPVTNTTQSPVSGHGFSVSLLTQIRDVFLRNIWISPTVKEEIRRYSP
jgi:hypothetical protein